MDLIFAHPNDLKAETSDPAVLKERERIAAWCEREANALRPSDWKQAFGSDIESAAECCGQIEVLEMVAQLLRGS